jgi:hypothetical protein
MFIVTVEVADSDAGLVDETGIGHGIGDDVSAQAKPAVPKKVTADTKTIKLILIDIFRILGRPV